MTNAQPKQIDELYVNDMMKALSRKNQDDLDQLLQTFQAKNEQTKTRLLYEISMAGDEDVFFVIKRLLSDTPKSEDFNRFLMDLLLDKARTNSRFVIPFIDHADLYQLKEAVPLFAALLLSETDTDILQKTIRAIGETGEKSCVNVIGDFIFYDHEGLKREAIEALGKIGGPSAIKRLAFASQTSKSDDYLQATLDKLESRLSIEDPIETQPEEQFASKKDTLDQLSGDSDLARLITLLNSRSPLDRLQAMDALVEKGVQAIPAVIESMDEDNPDTLINSLNILGKIASEAALPAVLKLLNRKHPNSNIRFAAYEAMSRLPMIHVPLSLMDGITDTAEHVRLAAATAMNKNPSEIMISGLKSKIETAGKRSKKAIITAAIIDSHSGMLFRKLLDSDSFVFLASDHLTNSHENTVAFFSDILIKRGSKSLALTIRENVKDKRKENPLSIFCVDESLINLKYCMKLFHNAGHMPYGFETPAEALAALKQKKPDLIITDFNITGIHGLHLVENIRNIYGKRELPIVVITTQNDLADVNESQKRLYEVRCLMDLVIQKPLELKAIKPLLDRMA
jgi:HEAT repeat protein